jgi:hypothetical protein
MSFCKIRPGALDKWHIGYEYPRDQAGHRVRLDLL